MFCGKNIVFFNSQSATENFFDIHQFSRRFTSAVGRGFAMLLRLPNILRPYGTTHLKPPTSYLITSYLLPKNILPLPHRSLAVLDGVNWAMVIAAHAHRAVAVPFRVTIFEGDVLQRTRFHALAAMDASLADAILAIVGGRAVETGIHQISLDPSQTPHDYFGKTFLINETRNVSL